jgi:hypothetical protein
LKLPKSLPGGSWQLIIQPPDQFVLALKDGVGTVATIDVPELARQLREQKKTAEQKTAAISGILKAKVEQVIEWVDLAQYLREALQIDVEIAHLADPVLT